MKRIFFSVVMRGLLFFVVSTNSGFAQSVGIGTDTPDPSALLDLYSKNKGLLIPRLTMATRDDINNPAKGLLVYVSDDNSFYFFDGGWRRLTPTDEVWSIKGNNGIDTSVHFIGTTDNKPVRFKVNNTLRMQLDSSGRLQLYGQGEGLFIGYEAGINNTGTRNYFTGYKAGLSNTAGFRNYFSGNYTGMTNTTGVLNFFVGNWAGFSNTTADHNHFSGYSAGYNNTTGGLNYFTGNFAGLNNITGGNNHFSGNLAGSMNTTGDFNTMVGNRADVTLANLTRAGAIGYNAKVSQSNSFVIGGTGADAVNVGIGTTAPQMKLDVQSNAPNSNIAIFGSTGGFGQIYVTQGTSVTDLGSYPTGGYTGTNSVGDFKIRTGSMDRMFFQHSTGRVGIGTSTPTEALHVAGNIAVDGIIPNQAFQIPTLQGSWRNFGSGYSNAGYYKDKEGRVHLRGVVANASISVSPIFNLPAGYRPSSSNGILLFSVMNNNNLARVEIYPNGNVRIGFGASGWFNLEGISFRAE